MLGNRKLKIEIKGTEVSVTNLTDYLLENCLIDIKTILYGAALFNKFDINPSETIHFNLTMMKMIMMMIAIVLDSYQQKWNTYYHFLPNSKVENLITRQVSHLIF